MDAVEQGSKAGQAGGDDTKVMLCLSPSRDWNVRPCCDENLVNRKLFLKEENPEKGQGEWFIHGMSFSKTWISLGSRIRFMMQTLFKNLWSVYLLHFDSISDFSL